MKDGRTFSAAYGYNPWFHQSSQTKLRLDRLECSEKQNLPHDEHFSVFFKFGFLAFHSIGRMLCSFCRNLFIYFEEKLKKLKLSSVLPPQSR